MKTIYYSPSGQEKTSSFKTHRCNTCRSLTPDRLFAVSQFFQSDSPVPHVTRMFTHHREIVLGKTLVTFLDDMNMPEKEVYGAQPPLELIRQWIDYGFWYDRQQRFLKNVKNMLLIGAMGPPGGGRNTVSSRLISCFSVVNLTFPEEAQISSIYKTMLGQHLESFDESLHESSTI